MKTKDLIAALQDADPSGELECCVGNADIHTVYPEPAYWDGCLQVLIHDKNKAPYYDVVGAKIVGKGTKVVIHPLSISDAIANDHDLPIEYEGVSELKRKDYEESYMRQRQESIDISNDVERGFFIQWINEKGIDLTQAAIDFYNANMKYNDPMPEDIMHSKLPKDKDGLEWIPSWKERRERQWEREIEVIDRKIKKR